MNRRRFSPTCLRLLGTGALAFAFFFLAAVARAEKLQVPQQATAILERIYSFDLSGAVSGARSLQEKQPDQPLGYLLEAEALWWKMWCTSAEFKYGMTYTWRRGKLPADERYLELAGKASSLAQALLKEHTDAHKSAETQLYAGLGDAFAARLYGWRGEARATARAGVRAREHFLRARQLDPDVADTEFGLGLYNYYVDTLSGIAKFLGFFMGIPGGNKQQGIRQLEEDIAKGVLTPDAARFYLAINLHRFDQQYERAVGVINPLAEKYPSNPIFQLVRGDLYAKLARKPQAIACYKAAAALPMEDANCRDHLRELADASLSAQGVSGADASH